MRLFAKIVFLSGLLGISLTAISGLVFERGIDFQRRGVPLCWIETQGIKFLGLDSYVIHRKQLIVDLLAWTAISSVLLIAYLYRRRE